MRYLVLLISLLVFQGCSAKQGDYVHYSYANYDFMQRMFIENSLDCVELGTIKQTQMNAKYCKSKNYARVDVEGFVFVHEYKTPEERLIAARLYFETKKPLVLNCTSEVLNTRSRAGEEYIVCLVAKREFFISDYILKQKDDFKASLVSPIGNKKIYGGTITAKAKALISDFIYHSDKKEFIDKSL